MNDVEQFSRALSAIAQAGAYSAKDIRQICAQEVQYVEETVLWADNVPYAVVRTPTVQVPVYMRGRWRLLIFRKRIAGLIASLIVGRIAWSPS